MKKGMRIKSVKLKRKTFYILADLLNFINDNLLEEEKTTVPIIVKWNDESKHLTTNWYIVEGCVNFILDDEGINLQADIFVQLIEKEATNNTCWAEDIYKSPMEALTDCEMYFSHTYEDADRGDITTSGYAKSIKVSGEGIIITVENMKE